MAAGWNSNAAAVCLGVSMLLLIRLGQATVHPSSTELLENTEEEESPRPKISLTCLNSSTLLVQGEFIRLADILTKLHLNTLDLPTDGPNCLPSSIRRLIIFAFSSVLIEGSDLKWEPGSMNMNRQSNIPGATASLFIIAPVWIIPEKTTIRLDGARGEDGLGWDVDNNNNRGHGKPGGAGENSGWFLGIGASFIGGGSLKVSANGGIGGAGAVGRDGSEGAQGAHAVNGRVASYSDSVRYSDGSWHYGRFHEENDRTDLVNPFVAAGLKGAAGEVGGDGGKGGNGGRAQPSKLVQLSPIPISNRPHILSPAFFTAEQRQNPNFVSWLHSPAGVQLVANEGAPGSDGLGGKGGAEGRKGALQVYIRKCGIARREFHHIYQCNTDPRCKPPQADPGRTGGNFQGRKNPPPPLSSTTAQKEILHVLNQFKSLSWRYLAGDVHEQAKTVGVSDDVSDFLQVLDSSPVLREKYDVYSLYEELQLLEMFGSGIRTDKEKMVRILLPAYKSLFGRAFALAQANPEKSEVRKALTYLYTIVMSRLRKVASNEVNSILITSVTKYLTGVMLDMDKFSQAQKVSTSDAKFNLVQETYAKFDSQMQVKLEEAQHLIHSVIQPDINRIQDEIQKKIKELVGEIRRMIRDRSENVERLEELKRQLQRQQTLNLICGIFKVVGTALSFLGPWGKLAGAVVGAGTSIAQAALKEDVDKDKAKVAALPSSVLQLSADLRTQSEQSLNALDGLVTNVRAATSSHSGEFEKLERHVGRITTRVHELKTKSQSQQALPPSVFTSLETFSNLISTRRLIREARRDIQRTLGDKRLELAEQERDKRARTKREAATAEDQGQGEDAEEKAVGEITDNVGKLTDAALSPVSTFSNDKDEIGKVEDLIRQEKANIRALEMHEERVHNFLMPMLSRMRESFESAGSALGDKSAAVLDVGKWRVQSSIRILKAQVSEQFTAGFTSVDGPVRQLFDQLEAAMVALIQVYDRIQASQDQSRMVRCIADLSAIAHLDEAKNPDGGDGRDLQLVQLTHKLDGLLQRSIVLEQHDLVLKSVHMWAFPFASNYANEFEEESWRGARGGSGSGSGSTVEKDPEDSWSLASSAIKALEQVQNAVIKQTGSTSDLEKSVTEWEWAGSRKTEPFFSWPRTEHAALIHRVLTSKEDTFIQVDVRKSSVDKSAIKFRTIRLNFKFHPDPSRDPVFTKNGNSFSALSQAAFDLLLEKFQVELTHMGYSYYRFQDKVYVLPSTPVTFSYHYRQQGSGGQFMGENAVLGKYSAGDISLSPYGLWKIRISPGEGFEPKDLLLLQQYHGHLDMVLEGKGVYVDERKLKKESALEVDHYYGHYTTDINNEDQAEPPILTSDHHHQLEQQQHASRRPSISSWAKSPVAIVSLVTNGILGIILLLLFGYYYYYYYFYRRNVNNRDEEVNNHTKINQRDSPLLNMEEIQGFLKEKKCGVES